jgi:hypothetical protein
VDISDWLRELDLDVYADVFRANAIDADLFKKCRMRTSRKWAPCLATVVNY